MISDLDGSLNPGQELELEVTFKFGHRPRSKSATRIVAFLFQGYRIDIERFGSIAAVRPGPPRKGKVPLFWSMEPTLLSERCLRT